MSDTVITMPNGDQYSPATSTETFQCASCDQSFATLAEAQAYAATCSTCSGSWTEKRSTTISIAAPQPIGGDTL